MTYYFSDNVHDATAQEASRIARHAHRAPIPEEEPLPGDEPVPEDDSAPHPDPMVREPGEAPPVQFSSMLQNHSRM